MSIFGVRVGISWPAEPLCVRVKFFHCKQSSDKISRPVVIFQTHVRISRPAAARIRTKYQKATEMQADRQTEGQSTRECGPQQSSWFASNRFLGPQHSVAFASGFFGHKAPLPLLFCAKLRFKKRPVKEGMCFQILALLESPFGVAPILLCPIDSIIILLFRMLVQSCCDFC